MEEEVVVLPIKELNRNDFHECLKPVLASQFSVPEGDFTFPMKERYEKVRTGHASDALEGPDTTPLENRDAEVADEQNRDVADADRKVERPNVIDPVSSKLVPLPGGGRFYDSGGTLGRRYVVRYVGTRGSTKPDDIPSHLWVNMSNSQEMKAIDEANMRAALQEIDEGDGRGSSTDRPASAASRAHDVWGICGDTLIRYRFKLRNELFSPDLTDCPFDLSRISSSRYTKIIPCGGDSIMDDEDDWRNVRRRNKKLRFKWIGQTVFKIKPASDPTPNGDGSYPAMPVTPDDHSEHSDKLARSAPISDDEIMSLMAMVARPVGKKELMQNAKAQASLDVEWEKLMKKKAWEMESDRGWEDVSSSAQKCGRKVHVGKIFEICVEKGSGLPEGDPLRKFKGRTVFQGNNVKDESNDTALFSELGSSPGSFA